MRMINCIQSVLSAIKDLLTLISGSACNRGLVLHITYFLLDLPALALL